MSTRQRTTRQGPRNSLGQPWVEGQTWTCARCGGRGPDRDDVVLSECGSGETRRSYHDLTFHPAAHGDAIAGRRPLATRTKLPGEVVPGDMLVMTRRVLWRVLSVAPYGGPLPELAGAVVAQTDRGPITLEGETEVLA